MKNVASYCLRMFNILVASTPDSISYQIVVRVDLPLTPTCGKIYTIRTNKFDSMSRRQSRREKMNDELTIIVMKSGTEIMVMPRRRTLIFIIKVFSFLHLKQMARCYCK